MIETSKEKWAFKAIQSVLIHVRNMAHEGKSHSLIAEILDTAEYLTGLLYFEDDCTSEFCQNVEELKKNGIHIYDLDQ